jgi:AraC-like DNA-binding protein
MAAHELHSGSKSRAEVAGEAGYDSEAAFSRAFKREFELPPASWRTSQERLVSSVGNTTVRNILPNAN